MSTSYDFQTDILATIASCKTDLQWLKSGGSLDKIDNAFAGIFPDPTREEMIINIQESMIAAQARLITLLSNNLL